MSARNRGTKKRRWSNVRRPMLMMWKCPDCEAALQSDEYSRARPGPALKYGERCAACLTVTGAPTDERCSCGALLSNYPGRDGCRNPNAHYEGARAHKRLPPQSRRSARVAPPAAPLPTETEEDS